MGWMMLTVDVRMICSCNGFDKLWETGEVGESTRWREGIKRGLRVNI